MTWLGLTWAAMGILGIGRITLIDLLATGFDSRTHTRLRRSVRHREQV